MNDKRAGAGKKKTKMSSKSVEFSYSAFEILAYKLALWLRRTRLSYLAIGDSLGFTTKMLCILHCARVAAPSTIRSIRSSRASATILLPRRDDGFYSALGNYAWARSTVCWSRRTTQLSAVGAWRADAGARPFGHS